MSDVLLDLKLPHTYEVQVTAEAPPRADDERYFYFPSAAGAPGPGSIFLEVWPSAGPRWFGTFADGAGPSSFSAVFSAPHEDHLCVVSKGSGIIVDSRQPASFVPIDLFPIVEVRVVLDPKLLVFVSLTRIAAYDRDGKRWKTPDLSWDGLRVTSQSSRTIEALAWDVVTDRHVNVFVDLETGQFTGGASPSLPNSR